MIDDVVDRFQKEHVRWRMARKPLRIVLQWIVVAVLAMAAFLLLRISGGLSETAASVLVAVVFGVVTVVQQRQAQRRQHTVGLITAFQTADNLASADVWMASRISSHQPVNGDISNVDECHVITMLDYYEFLVVLALRGVVDTPLLVRLRGGTMARCYYLCRGYIEDRRRRTGSEIYNALELFASGIHPRPAENLPGVARDCPPADDPGSPAS